MARRRVASTETRVSAEAPLEAPGRPGEGAEGGRSGEVPRARRRGAEGPPRAPSGAGGGRTTRTSPLFRGESPAGEVGGLPEGVRGVAVAVVSAAVLTVEAHDPLWRGSAEGAGHVREEWRGAFVRLRPPASAEDAVVMAARDAAASVARAVRVMPRARAVVPAARSASGRTSLRETVTRMVAEARTEDREALRREVEAAMGAVGL